MANKNYHHQQGKTHSISRHVLTESGHSVFFLVDLRVFFWLEGIRPIKWIFYSFKYLKVSEIFTLFCNNIIHDLYSTGF